MSTTTTQANKIATVIIPVADQDAAVDFYVSKLGFEKRVDIPFGNGYRWIEVGLGAEGTTLALAPPPGEGATGKRETGISLQADDIDAYHTRLKQMDVDVDAEVSRMGDPVPPMFWLRDPEGNSLIVVQ
jgi:catechol 2,3-dioxygenase-like lactoylglutathione lyase family enzyme